MKVIAMIPARYEASRFPGKLMKLLGDKTVIRCTYEAAVASGLFEQVIVVTDSDVIIDEIRSINGQVIKSKKTHQSGSDRIAEAAADMDVDIIVNVQGDEPFINAESLSKLIAVFQDDTECAIDVASLMIRINDPVEIQNPNTVKVVCDEKGHALYFSRAPIPYPREKTKASYFRHIGIYAFRKSALIQFTKLKMSKLEKIEKLENLRFLANGMTVKMVETDALSVGIDTVEDLEKANQLLKKP